MNLPEPLVLTNDDGIDAPGLRALREALGGRGILAAPLHPHSGCSHYVTTNRAISVEERGPGAYAIDGSPPDCVRLALLKLVPDAKLLISGINAGGNLGHDIYLSGTVAAAREATFMRTPAISISQYFRKGQEVNWDRTACLAREALEAVLDKAPAPGSFWNINLPAGGEEAPEPEIIFCAPCIEPLPAHYRQADGGYFYEPGHYHNRTRVEGTDVAVCFGGDISISRLTL